MRCFARWRVSLLASLVPMAIMVIAPQSASAQAAYGSYIGVGGSVGTGEDTNAAGVISARYKLLELPISLRAQAFVGDGAALVPTVSYDIPINWQTDTYIGAGVSLADGDTPVGEKTSFALQPGIDYVLPNSEFVLFGNAIIAFDADRDDGGAAVSVQGGVGLQF